MLFINAYNNSLEEKYKSAAEGGGVCLSKLRLQRWGTEGTREKKTRAGGRKEEVLQRNCGVHIKRINYSLV